MFFPPVHHAQVRSNAPIVIPVHIENGIATVMADFNGRKLPMLIDSGAWSTSVDRDMMETGEENDARSFKVPGWLKNVRARLTASVPVFEDAAVHPHMAGVIGIDLLRMAPFGLDYKAHTLTVWPKGVTPQQAANWISPEANECESIPLLNGPFGTFKFLAEIGGQKTSFLIDTGDNTIVLGSQFKPAGSEIIPLDASSASFTATARESQRVAVLSTLTINDHEWPPVLASVSKMFSNNVMGPKQLFAPRAIIDAPHMKMYVSAFDRKTAVERAFETIMPTDVSIVGNRLEIVSAGGSAGPVEISKVGKTRMRTLVRRLSGNRWGSAPAFAKIAKQILDGANLTVRQGKRSLTGEVPHNFSKGSVSDEDWPKGPAAVILGKDHHATRMFPGQHKTFANWLTVVCMPRYETPKVVYNKDKTMSVVAGELKKRKPQAD